jgi:hypothetical protein
MKEVDGVVFYRKSNGAYLGEVDGKKIYIPAALPIPFEEKARIEIKKVRTGYYQKKVDYEGDNG